MTTTSIRRSAIQVTNVRVATLAHYAVLVAIVVAGAFLRLTALNRQSLWFDEVDVVVRAQQPLGTVLRTFVAEGENGPLYNILLALWVRIAGVSEIAVRFPSAVAGTLSIPLIYLLGRRLAGSSVGLLAAGLLAISPYHVWYSQEAKMYALVVLLALASSACLVEALERNHRLWWAAYAVVTTLLFYTHVATVLVFVAQSLYVVLTRRTWRGRERGWIAAAAVLTLPYLPIAIWAMRVVGGGVQTWQPDVSLWEAARIFGIKFAVNRADSVIETRGALLYAALAVAGAIMLATQRRRERWWLLLVALSAVPVVGLFLVSLRQSVFSDRYAIVTLPAYLLLVAAAVALLSRHRLLWPLGALSIFLLLAFAWGPLRDVNRSTAAEKEDWRSAYAWVAERGQPHDVLLLHPGYMITTYDYYLQREPRLEQFPVVTIPSFSVKWLDEPLMVQMIRDQAGDARRYWLIESPDRADVDDPDARLAGWLQRRGTLLAEHEVNGVHLRLFELDEPPAPERP
ncbi:MAG TPA: glycosyltransferase family 39 protein [Thermomicrobiales bacterium]|nr:glycosyltransferase family 39 protein [Thermomicrobiales bacterium]